jgi:hypothetical protein
VAYRPAWAPDEIEIEQPSVARMYDYYLGGSHNFAADRQLAERATRAFPDVREFARANRAFLRRAVTFLADAGVNQFLDLGSGIPTVGNVHEVAQAADPNARTAYVDSDPVAYAHGSALLAGNPQAMFLQADLRDSESVLTAPELTGFLDLSQPVAVLLFSVLPFVPEEDDPAGIVAAYRDATAPGSYLALSHGTADYRPEAANSIAHVYNQASHSMTPRSRAQILGLMTGYQLVEPGLIDIIRWRPEPNPLPDPLHGDVERYSMYAAVGRK